MDKSKSTTGYIFTLIGNPISWKSCSQHAFTLSTIEVEYIASIEASKESIWLKALVSYFGLEQEKVLIFCDNQSAISLTKNPVNHDKTKHIDYKMHYVREGGGRHN